MKYKNHEAIMKKMEGIHSFLHTNRTEMAEGQNLLQDIILILANSNEAE